jgi:thiol-disulfide isomerase/thioredoxin
MKYWIALVLIAAVLAAGCTGQPPTAAAVSGKDILEFYGDGCLHCKNMEPVVAQVEQELGMNITMYEVWFNEANREVFFQYRDIAAPACGGDLGVPAFVNLRTQKAICGEKSAAELKAFILE